MKIMGLPNWLHWTAWFVKSFIILFILTILVVITLKVNYPNNPLLVKSDKVVLVVLLTVYSFPVITCSFALSVFFNNGKLITKTVRRLGEIKLKN